MKFQVPGLKFQVGIAVAALSVAALSQTSCSTVAAMGEAAGVITSQQAQSIVRAGDAVQKSFADITPEQEYYIGRAVGATIVSKYKVYDEDAATRYVNLVGQTLAQASDKPETFAGYHFLILDSDEINAFAAPGGFIFISRGMLRLCHSEDELAAVLAHEIGHVQLAHALRAIKTSRLTSAFTILAAEGAKNYGGEAVAQLTQQFEGSISDVTQTLVVNGYGRGQEREADKVAVTILGRVGYDPWALSRVLAEMGKHLKPGGHDFAATHPPPSSRIEDLHKQLDGVAAIPVPAARQMRYDRSMRGV
jgi:predicted Zn-dependent protease